jgi:hypothetical protein
MVIRILCWTLLIVCGMVNINDILETGYISVVTCQIEQHCTQLCPSEGVGCDHWTRLFLTGQAEYDPFSPLYFMGEMDPASKM